MLIDPNLLALCNTLFKQESLHMQEFFPFTSVAGLLILPKSIENPGHMGAICVWGNSCRSLEWCLQIKNKTNDNMLHLVSATSLATIAAIFV